MSSAKREKLAVGEASIHYSRRCFIGQVAALPVAVACPSLQFMSSKVDPCVEIDGWYVKRSEVKSVLANQGWRDAV